MAYNKTFADASELTSEARVEYERVNGLLPLASWFPDSTENVLNYQFDILMKSNVDEAEYRDWDTENPKGASEPRARIMGELPPLGRDYRWSEQQQVAQFNAEAKSIATRDALIARARRGGLGIAKRLERARVSALLYGRVELSSESPDSNMNGVVDYGRRSNLHFQRAGNAQWSDQNSDVLGQLEEMFEAVREASDVLPSTLLVSRDVYQALRAHKQIRERAFAGAASTPAVIGRDDVTRVISDEFGNIVRVIDMTTLYATSGINGLPSLWPNGTLVAVPAPSLDFGATKFGITAFAVDDQYGIAQSDRPGIFAKAFDQDNHANLWVGVHATALPILPGVNQVATSGVLASAPSR